MSYGIRYTFYQSKAWKQVRTFVYQRDRGICQECGRSKKYMIVHHVEHLTDSNVNDVNISLNPDNLILVCKDCHELIHSKEDTTSLFDDDGNYIGKKHKQLNE